LSCYPEICSHFPGNKNYVHTYKPSQLLIFTSEKWSVDGSNVNQGNKIGRSQSSSKIQLEHCQSLQLSVSANINSFIECSKDVRLGTNKVSE
jgi:hypothetical protein